MTPFIKGHITVYYIILIIINALIYSLIILIIYMLIKLKKKDLTILWPISLLRLILPIISFGLFGQIFLFLIVLFDCQDGHSYASEEVKCKDGNWYILYSPFVGISILLHILLGIMTNLLYHRSVFVSSKNDILKKSNPINDIWLLFTKIILIILFILDTYDENKHWTFLFILIIITGINAYINIYFKNRINKKLIILILFSHLYFL